MYPDLEKFEESTTSKETREDELNEHAVDKTSSCSPRLSITESGELLRLAASVIRRGGVAGMYSDLEKFNEIGTPEDILEDELSEHPEHQDTCCSSGVRLTESSGTLRLAASVIRRGGVAKLSLDSGPLVMLGGTLEIYEDIDCHWD